MSQVYTDDCYDPSHTAATDLQNMENNFAALKSMFSGATAPSNTIAFMPWGDTTAHIWKLRNEANNAWQSVWDMVNNKPVITNLSNEITAAMINSTYKDGAAATACLRTLGTTALVACAGNDARLSRGQLKIGVISPARGMSTDSGDVSYSGVGFQPTGILFLAQCPTSIAVGLDNGTDRYAVTVWSTTPYYSSTAVLSISMIESGTKMQTGLIKTFDSDGFTITWTRTGTPAVATTAVYYLAFKG